MHVTETQERKSENSTPSSENSSLSTENLAKESRNRLRHNLPVGRGIYGDRRNAILMGRVAEKISKYYIFRRGHPDFSGVS